jgi:mannose-6-phosphate isomerase-like protein (cupin superfamily)
VNAFQPVIRPLLDISKESAAVVGRCPAVEGNDHSRKLRCDTMRVSRKEKTMRGIVVAVGLCAVLSLSIWAQQRQGQNPPPLQGGQFSASDFAALVARQPKDRNGNATFLQLAPYNVNMEHRVPIMQNASVHEKEAELFYIVDGAGTMVTGGKLTNEKRNGDNLTGDAIEGGTSKKIAKGDFILVPEGQPHWFSKIDGELTMMSLHLPRK